MITGGFLAGAYLSGLFIPVIGLTLSGIVLTLFLSDTTRGVEPSSLSGKVKFPSVKSLLRGRLLTALFAVGLFSNLTYEPADQFWQVLFSEIRGVPASYFGLLTAAGLILVVLTAKLTQKLYYRLGWYLTGCFILISAALLVSVQASIYPAIAGIVVYFALKELVRPAISANLNRIIESRNRATYLSGYNMVCSVGEVLAGVTAGVLASQYGVPFIIILSACAAIAVIGIYFILGFRRWSAAE